MIADAAKGVAVIVLDRTDYLKEANTPLEDKESSHI